MKTQPSKSTKTTATQHDFALLDRIAKRAHYTATRMIQIANSRKDKEKGDPKVGGHASASASSLHILGSLHLVVKTGFDHMAVKPHTSPTDHSYNYLLDLLLDENNQRLPENLATTALHGLRKFSQNGEPVFQSYHSAYDPDRHNFFPSGTVGIPPVNAGYLAHAYRYAENHGYEVPANAHFWSLMGDSEFREGSLLEAMPDFAEREIGNLTWIVDYNRQSLDGHRIVNEKIYGGSDDYRIEKTFEANGWEVIQVRHGRIREELFEKTGGDAFQKWIESELRDYQLQTFLLSQDTKAVRAEILRDFPHLATFLKTLSDDTLHSALRDFGGHDFPALIAALTHSRRPKNRPTLIIAHTLKGWGLRYAAAPGNHSALPHDDEVDELMTKQGISAEKIFERFTESTPEGKFCRQRGNQLYQQILEQHALKEKNRAHFMTEIEKNGGVPPTFNINTKMASYPHTQWMLGQLTAKLTRVSNTSTDAKQLTGGQKALTAEELAMKLPGELLISMAPDVGTSTNLNPAMDGKVFGATETEDFEQELHVKDTKLPDLVPGEEKSDRFLRFEIAECNVMSCVGSYGKLRDTLGIPLIPLMTVYDFFIKRALDQHFYNLYWKSSFILVGTPSGVTLSPEGAQHGWKSDIQIPNQITWEPFFCAELDWIFAESIKRHVNFDNEGRSGVLIRGVTRGIDQTELLRRTRRQVQFKSETPSALLCLSDKMLDGGLDEVSIAAKSDAEIMESVRQDCLNGAYYLIDYRGYAGYEPGDNVVNIFAMGALGTEAIKASDSLLERGIYANVIIVTSSDLLIGNQAHENNYTHLRDRLGINSSLYVSPYVNGEMPTPDMMTVAGRRVPMVSVHDGEPGLLDNIGSVVGVRHESLAVRKHSKCGRPSEIYAYHHIDAAAVVEAAGQVLGETALEKVKVTKQTLASLVQSGEIDARWTDLWTSARH